MNILLVRQRGIDKYKACRSITCFCVNDSIPEWFDVTLQFDLTDNVIGNVITNLEAEDDENDDKNTKKCHILMISKQ